VSEATAGRRYLRAVTELTAGLEQRAWPGIEAGAALLADAMAGGRVIHAFGTGHSHMLAEEMSYRAGGLARVRPILFEGLMLHASAPLSTVLERLPGLAAALLEDHPLAAGDVLIIASNSGGNTVVTEMAQLARDRAVAVIAITSLAHATSEAARARADAHLHDLADVVIDNGGSVGDAAVRIEALATAVGPTSTVVGAAIVNALVAETVERLVRAGLAPDVFTSANVTGGDALNARILKADEA
jgi:uncharacterized phosphosugar-binding protein